MKAVLISMHPEQCEKIANGDETGGIWKKPPKLKPPFKCYIYCTDGKMLFNGKKYVPSWEDKLVLAYLSNTTKVKVSSVPFINRKVIGEFMCNEYDRPISDLKIYDEPKELGEFYRSLSKKILENGNYDCRKDWDVLCLDAPEGGDYCAECIYCGRVQITRPPQSWCYVEEL